MAATQSRRTPMQGDTSTRARPRTALAGPAAPPTLWLLEPRQSAIGTLDPLKASEDKPG